MEKWVMKNVKSIDNNLAVATCQLTPEQLQEASKEGFKSVLNLRSPQEEGYLSDEAERARAANLEYVNIPVKPDEINEELADKVLETIEQLPKPILSHCKSGLRSGAFALMYDATRHNLSAEQAMEKGRSMGFDCDKSEKMKAFFKQYVSEHSAA
jgi:uncharacterized protein (TIGR01244 family)